MMDIAAASATGRSAVPPMAAPKSSDGSTTFMLSTVDDQQMPVERLVTGTPLNLTPVDLSSLFTYDPIEVGAYWQEYGDYMRQVSDFVREKLGLNGVPGGTALGLTGKIIEIAKQAAAKAGILPPNKPASVETWEAEQDRTASPDSGISQITIAFNNNDSLQLLFDEKKLEALLSQPTEKSLSDLVDMNGDNDAAETMALAMLNGRFGGFFADNAEYHPDWAGPQAVRLGLTDPTRPWDKEPILMMQANGHADMVERNTGTLIQGLMDMLRAGT